MLNQGVTFNLGSAKVCSSTIFETYFSYRKDIWIAVNIIWIFIQLRLFALKVS